jgi:hypothetical protein
VKLNCNYAEINLEIFYIRNYYNNPDSKEYNSSMYNNIFRIDILEDAPLCFLERKMVNHNRTNELVKKNNKIRMELKKWLLNLVETCNNAAEISEAIMNRKKEETRKHTESVHEKNGFSIKRGPYKMDRTDVVDKSLQETILMDTISLARNAVTRADINDDITKIIKDVVARKANSLREHPDPFNVDDLHELNNCIDSWVDKLNSIYGVNFFKSVTKAA